MTTCWNRTGPTAEGSYSTSSSFTALRAASPAHPGSAASTAAWRANGYGAGDSGRRADAACGTGGRSGSTAHRQNASRAHIPWMTRMLCTVTSG
jgi:hypothetical protein